VPDGFGELLLAVQLGLHYNHPSSQERRELTPGEAVRRADAAYALYRAATADSWKLDSMDRYRRVALPNFRGKRRKAVEFALAYTGYPYVYAGEWHKRTPPGYCCGAQVQGGFDCSGYVWWVLRKAGNGWDNTRFRPYAGWALPQRSSRDMAREAPRRISWRDSRPLDIMFFDGDGGSGWTGVDHAGIFLGRGWMIDSSSGRGGVALAWGRDGWYRDHFVWSRRIVRN
jgi:cell wall-associated NlpC family hydrolase